MQHTPAEIINEIFKHLIVNILHIHDPRKFPWYLGQICASWRADFTATPWIWRKFMIDMDQITERDLDNAAHLVKLCIQRSRNQPLSFSFLYTHNLTRRPKGGQYANQLLSDLIAESQRWEEIDVEADLVSLESFRLPDQSNPFPLLRSMTLRTNGIRWDKPKFQELFLRAHSLTRVAIECFPTYGFDWSQLTVLALHYASNIADVLPVMRKLHCIERFQLNVYLGHADEEQDAMIPLPTLKVLSCTSNLLRHLRAPALEELRIMNTKPSFPFPDGAISFLRTSSGSITRLILGNRCCIASDVKHILQELPNVTNLCLAADLDLSDVLPLDLEEGIQILPKLELLTVDGYSREWDAVETLWDFVVSRISKPSLFEWPCRAGKLKELRMISCENLDTSNLMLLCQEHKVKYLASKRIQQARHLWCTEVENCAFDLCYNHLLLWSAREPLFMCQQPGYHRVTSC